jgi:hypothetical protein
MFSPIKRREQQREQLELYRSITKPSLCVHVIASRALKYRAQKKTRVRIALIAPGLIDCVEITEAREGENPVYRREISLPLTLAKETYTHLSVECLDEAMSEVVGFGLVEFDLIREKKGKIAGKWIAMWDDLREEVVGHVCVRVSLEGGWRERGSGGDDDDDGKEASDATRRANADASATNDDGNSLFEIGRHQISEGRKQLLNRFARTPNYKKPEEITKEAQENVRAKSKELEEEKKKRALLEKQLDILRKEKEEDNNSNKLSLQERQQQQQQDVSVATIASDFESSMNRTRDMLDTTTSSSQQQKQYQNITTNNRSMTNTTQTINPPLSPVRASQSLNTTLNRSNNNSNSNNQMTKEQALRNLRQRGLLQEVSTINRKSSNVKNFVQRPISLVARIANNSRRQALKRFAALRAVVQTIDPNILVGAAIGLFLVGFRTSRTVDERDLRFVTVEDVDISAANQQQVQQQKQKNPNIDYIYYEDPRGPIRRGEYEVKPGDSLCAASGCVLPERVEVRDAQGNLVKFPDVIYPGDRIKFFN